MTGIKNLSKRVAMSKKRYPSKELPLSGSEPVFRYKPWGTTGIHANNCYDYAIGDYKSYRPVKSAPGDRAGMKPIGGTLRRCTGLRKRVLADNPGKVYLVDYKTKCRKGFYKIMMFVAPTNDYRDPNGDFHFYKQHSQVKYTVKPGDTPASLSKFFQTPVRGPLKPGKTITVRKNLFSHKMGWGTGPLLVDSNNNIIVDPILTARDYGYNYTDYCSSFCVKKGKAKSGV